MINRNFNISVAMATFNGEKYINEQIDSILPQLCENDEIIISDDGSTDNTIQILKEYRDNRIKIICGSHKGVKQNFANAISHCNGKYIFLSDQDDIWINNKVNNILNEFEKHKYSCIVHDCLAFDSNSGEVIIPSFFKFRKSKKGKWKNIIKNSYIGCCMAFNSNLKNKILPIPEEINMHDQWIGLIAEKYGKVKFINKILLKYRRHDNNVSKLKHKSIKNMILDRYNLIKKLGET